MIILDYIKKYWVKSILAVISFVFLVFLGVDIFLVSGIAGESYLDPKINFYLKAALIAVSASVCALFSGKAIEALADGVLTSPKGLVVGIWLASLGVFITALFEELPEAIIIRLEKSTGLVEHDHPLHWIHHYGHQIIDEEINLAGTFLIILGGFLMMISSQMLDKKRVLYIFLGIIATMVFFGMVYKHFILSYLGV
jgi:hypothetical protein